MKKLLVLVLLVLALSTCRKEEGFDEYGFFGEGTAYLNGAAWSGKTGVFFTDVFCAPDSCIGIKLLYRNKNGYLRGDITLNHVPLQVGRQTLNYAWPVSQDVYCALSYSTWADDGDIVTGDYSVFEQNDSNYLEILELNLKTGDISGRFQAAVARHEFWTPAGQVPDTIRITEGVFRGRIFRE